MGVMNQLAFGRKGVCNVSKTTNQISEKLLLPMASVEKKYKDAVELTREKLKARHQTELFREWHQFARMTKDYRMGKVDPRKKHRNGSVPLAESVKSSIHQSAPKKPREPPACSICKQVNHKCHQCKMPPAPKRRAIEMVDFDLDEMNIFDQLGIKVCKRCKKPKKVDDWI